MHTSLSAASIGPVSPQLLLTPAMSSLTVLRTVFFFFALCALVQTQSWDVVPVVSLLRFPETCLQ